MFLPSYLNLFSQQKFQRLIISGVMLLLLIPSLPIAFHAWFITPGQARQSYLIGFVDTQAFLKREGFVTPVMEWIHENTERNTHIWTWCDSSIFYFDRWVRPSSPYDIPAFLTIAGTEGIQALSREVAKDHIEYIVINTSRCALDSGMIHTDKIRWSIPDALQQQVQGWMQQHLKLIGQDHKLALYQVQNPSDNKNDIPVSSTP